MGSPCNVLAFYLRKDILDFTEIRDTDKRRLRSQIKKQEISIYLRPLRLGGFSLRFAFARCPELRPEIRKAASENSLSYILDERQHGVQTVDGE